MQCLIFYIAPQAAGKPSKGASTPSNIASNIAGNSFHLTSGVQGGDICWQLIASNIPSTPSNIAGKIKGLKISFCLILMPNFECDEVNLSFKFSLFLPKYVSTARTNIFSHKHKLILIVQVVRINYRHDVILTVTSSLIRIQLDKNKSII